MRTFLILLSCSSLLAAASCSSSSSSSNPSDGGANEASVGDGSVTTTADGFAWAQSFAAGSGTKIIDMAADATGVVLVGQLETSATFGTTALTGTNPDGDGFVAKLDPNGNVLWAKATSGSGGELEAVAIDPSGNIVVGGNDFGTAETFTLGTVTLTHETGMINGAPISAGGGPIFELDSNGNVLWGKLVATTGQINTGSVAITSGKIYAAGPIIDDAAFAPGGAMAVTGCGTAGCVYLAAYDSSGNIQWAKQAPSSPHRGTGEDPGEVWLAATTTNLDVAIGGYYSQAGGDSNDTNELVVSQYDLTGALVWTKVTPSTDSPMVNGLAVDATGNLYITGSSAGLQLGAITTAQYAAPFFAKYASTGDLAWGVGYSNLTGPADTAIALSDHLYSFGNGGLTGPMGVDSFDPSTGALLSDIPCQASQNLGAGVAASSAGVFVGGYGGPPATFGTKTLTTLGLFVAKLK